MGAVNFTIGWTLLSSFLVSLSVWGTFALAVVWEFPLFDWELEGSEEGSKFVIFALVVGTSVITYSHFYMNLEELSFFRKLLSSFLLLMLSLVVGGNLFSLFWGWEGVGLLSFLLISWFSGRFWASQGSKKAMLYNRGSDFFLLVLILGEKSGGGSLLRETSIECFPWEAHLPENLLSLSKLSFTFCVFLAISGKSAQFLFHPWLTSAMEGPTPVSALLHSSTMVVAGVFLYYKLFFFLEKSAPTMEVLLWSSILTILLSSTSALFHKDLKKVVALSTTSQLGFMMLMLSLGMRELALAHLFLHGFFKASIFMASGYFIHSTEGSVQDGRGLGMGGTVGVAAFFGLSNLALMGLPFGGAFWSKHSLIEIGSWTESTFPLLAFILLSFMLSASYSIRLLANSLGGLGSLEGGRCGGSAPKHSALLPFSLLLVGTLWLGASLLLSTTGQEATFGWAVSCTSGLSFLILSMGYSLHMSLPTSSWAGWHFFFTSWWNRSVLAWGAQAGGAKSESFLEKWLAPLSLKQKFSQGWDSGAGPSSTRGVGVSLTLPLFLVSLLGVVLLMT